MTPLASALDRCLDMMQRATPHEFDQDAWRDTIRQASIILDRHEAQQSTGKFFCPPALRRIGLTMLALTALVLIVKGF